MSDPARSIRLKTLESEMDALELIDHTPNTDTKLDDGGPNEMTAARLKGKLAATKPAGMVRMVSIADAGISVTPQVSTSTGHAAIRWWDGTVEIQSSDAGADPDIDFSKAVPAWDNDWSGQCPKEIYIWSCTGAADPTQSGNITHLTCGGDALTALDVSGLSSLTNLACNGNTLTSLDVSGCTSLAYLDCNANDLVSLDISGLTSLTEIDCSSNSLTSVRAENCVLSYGNQIGTSYYYGSDFSDNSLDADALDQIYTDLAEDSGATGILLVWDNSGTGSDDPTIATVKGYTVLDTEPGGGGI